MGLLQNSTTIILGFIVWVLMAPRLNRPHYGEKFLAYMTALLFSLLASSDLIYSKPVAFFFTVGGSFAFFYVILRITFQLSARRED